MQQWGKDADNRERGGKHEGQTYKQSQKHDVRKGQLALRMFVPDTRHRVSTSNFASSFPPRQKHGTRHIFSDACLLDSKAVILSAGLYGSEYFVASIEDYMHGQVGSSPAERGARATLLPRSWMPVGALMGAKAAADASDASAARETATRTIFWTNLVTS